MVSGNGTVRRIRSLLVSTAREVKTSGYSTRVNETLLRGRKYAVHSSRGKRVVPRL